jgi:hypothetical protein
MEDDSCIDDRIEESKWDVWESDRGVPFPVFLSVAAAADDEEEVAL